jgi:putative transposase
MIKIKEYYTSKKCPKCKTLNEVKGRNYQCKCGYKNHRDIVGAINILNNNTELNIERYNTFKYLQIA